MNPTLDIMFDYFRFAAYCSVVISSLIQLNRKDYKAALLFGDIVFAIGLMILLIVSNTSILQVKDAADIILTPASIVWAVFHYVSLLHVDKGNGSPKEGI